MFGLFSKDSTAKLQKQYEKILGEAMTAQRNGDIKTYSMLSQQADNLLKEIQQKQS